MRACPRVLVGRLAAFATRHSFFPWGFLPLSHSRTHTQSMLSSHDEGGGCGRVRIVLACFGDFWLVVRVFRRSFVSSFWLSCLPHLRLNLLCCSHTHTNDHLVIIEECVSCCRIAEGCLDCFRPSDTTTFRSHRTTFDLTVELMGTGKLENF